MLFPVAGKAPLSRLRQTHLSNSRIHCFLGPFERCFACRFLDFLAASLRPLAILLFCDPGLSSAPIGEQGTHLPGPDRGDAGFPPSPELGSLSGVPPAPVPRPFRLPSLSAGPAFCSLPRRPECGQEGVPGARGPWESAGSRAGPPRPSPPFSTSSAACRSGLDSVFIYYNLELKPSRHNTHLGKAGERGLANALLP